MLGATECRGWWGTAAALPLLYLCLAVRGSGLPKTAKGCPRQSWAAQGHGSSHCVAGIEQEVPTAVQANLRQIRATGKGQLGLAVTQGWGHSVNQVLAHAGEQTPTAASLPTLSSDCTMCPTCPEQRGITRLHILSSVNLLPLSSPTLSLCKQSSGAGAPPLEPMCTTETVPLVSATDTLLLSNQQHTKDKVRLLQRLYPSPPLQFQKSFHKN